MPQAEFRITGTVSALMLAMGCMQPPPQQNANVPPIVNSQAIDASFEAILAEHGMATAGAAIIKGGSIIWTGYYGEQVPNVPASASTMFNTGSISKTLASETILRLASAGALSLDESMAPHWVDPDLIDDPRHQQLTARMMLTHRSGFPNWRYTDPQFTLRFIRDPDTAYGYSGEGLEYVAKFAEQKTGSDFPELTKAQILAPLSLEQMSQGPQDWVRAHIVHPIDESGARQKPFCTDASARRCAGNGDWSAADELATTVEDYARFMIAVMQGDGVSESIHAERFTIQTSTAQDDFLRCALPDPAKCPTAQGYGLGWEVFEFDDATIVTHSGSDWSERAMAYYDLNSGDGIVLFLNGPSSSSIEALIDGMNALDPGSRMALLYRGWVDAYVARQEAE